MNDLLRVDILKNLRGKSSSNNVIDKEFRGLIPVIDNPQVPIVTPEQFFEVFDDMVYTLPLTGTNSVEYILLTCANILQITIDTGLDLQELLNEITALKEENFRLLQQNIELQTPTV